MRTSGSALYLHYSGIEEVKKLLDNLLSNLRHDDGGLAGVVGLHLQHVAEEGRHGGQHYLVGQELAVVTEDGDVSEQSILLAELGDANNVVVVTLEGDNTVPRGHYQLFNINLKK